MPSPFLSCQRLVLLLGLSLLATPVPATEFHVTPDGDDSARGTRKAPLRTIQRAADLAQPGDVVTVHAGIYRERVNPPRGGTSDRKRIVYRAAPGESVEIRGSEAVRNWTRDRDDVWRTTLPAAFFGSFNPFADLIRGDWFDGKGREHHTGAVYFDGTWLSEAARLEDVYASGGGGGAGAGGSRPAPLWFARVTDGETTLWARFPGADPNTRLVEVNVRRTVFYPDRPGRDFITVRGFALRHAATPWAPPTAEQIGLIGTHWSRGWIIEDCTVSHSICSGIALGKHGDAWDNTSANTAEGYVKTIERAFAQGWSRDRIGHHVVRRNTISHCEQAGVVGSLGAAFCTVEDNTIHDIHVRRLFTGAEMAGIKFHAAIDTVIRRNHIHHTCLGLWLDWMAQGTRVSANLFHDNAGQDLFVEVDHGPFVVDNNLFLSTVSLLDMSEGGAFAHNLFAGRIISRPELGRETPYHPAHTTSVAGLTNIHGGDHRFFNNVFVGAGRTNAPVETGGKLTDPQWRGGHGLWVYDFREYPTQAAGNVHFLGSRPAANETDTTVETGHDPGLRLEGEGEPMRLRFDPGSALGRTTTAPVTTARLGRARIPNLPYENPDGSPLAITTDFHGKRRSRSAPTAGPFETPEPGLVALPLR
jgi:alpha-N-arabinofuranosidase